MCPDMTKRNTYYGQAADVWALGIVLFTLITGYFPFNGKREQDLRLKIQKGKYYFPEESQKSIDNSEGHGPISTSVKNLIKKILEPDATKRLSISEILQDPWISEADQSERQLDASRGLDQSFLDESIS